MLEAKRENEYKLMKYRVEQEQRRAEKAEATIADQTKIIEELRAQLGRD